MVSSLTAVVLSTLAVSAFVAQFADARKLCGKSLVVHVGSICQETDCDAFENVTPKRPYSELALECCSRGCSQAVIEKFCCSYASRASVQPKYATTDDDDEVVVV